MNWQPSSLNPWSFSYSKKPGYVKIQLFTYILSDVSRTRSRKSSNWCITPLGNDIGAQFGTYAESNLALEIKKIQQIQIDIRSDWTAASIGNDITTWPVTTDKWTYKMLVLQIVSKSPWFAMFLKRAAVSNNCTTWTELHIICQDLANSHFILARCK